MRGETIAAHTGVQVQSARESEMKSGHAVAWLSQELGGTTTFEAFSPHLLENLEKPENGGCPNHVYIPHRAKPFRVQLHEAKHLGPFGWHLKESHALGTQSTRLSDLQL